ncbi:thioredoxin fold domain-containing protein [bacterium]|nr:thioredoxin fold domain-containing protein [bacterium]
MNTLIDFYADWCGPCIAMKPVFESLKSSHGSKINFKQVNVDEDPAQAQKFGVMSIPTFVVIDKEGKEIDRKMGAMPKESFEEWVKGHFAQV